MSYNEGWIKLHRRFIKWEWYDDPNVMRLFIHCLLLANHKPKEWRGNEVKKGQFITSYNKLSIDLGLSVQQIRTAIEKLQKTGEITLKTTSRYTIVTVCKYTTYQSSEKQSNTPDNNQSTINQQSDNNQITTTKNDKNIKNEKKRGVTRESLKILLNNFGKPIFAKELFEEPEFSEVFLDYWMNRWNNYHHQPNEVNVKECYRRLVELKKSGNDPVAVIRQTIRGDNKEFYPLRDQEYSEQKIAEEHVPQYLTRRL